MKKLLTVLLTLVMAVCLINLNGNHTKAEENTEYTYSWDGSNWSSSPITTYNKGDVINITSTGASIQLTINGRPQSTTSIAYEVKNNGATLKLEKAQGMMPPKAFIIDIDSSLIRCDKGLAFTAQGAWQDGYGQSVDLSTYGISFEKVGEENIATLSNGLASTDKHIFHIAGPLTITLNDSISFLTISSKSFNIYNASKFKIDGKNHTFKIESTSSDNPLIETNNNTTFTLKDVTLILNSDGDTSANRGLIVDKLVLDNSTVKISVTSAKTSDNIYALKCNSISDGYEVKGALTKDGPLQIATPNANGIYQINDATSNQMVNARYIEITPKPVTPTPTPSPSEPKDESCEKVIGPTWHWNESKGICEDYGVVGTSTR